MELALASCALTNVIDNLGRTYPPAPNDDCVELGAIPPLAGWSCLNSSGALRMACSTPSPGGVIAPPTGNLTCSEITICPVSGPAGAGTAPFHVWFNAPAIPNPG